MCIDQKLWRFWREASFSINDLSTRTPPHGTLHGWSAAGVKTAVYRCGMMSKAIEIRASAPAKGSVLWWKYEGNRTIIPSFGRTL